MLRPCGGLLSPLVHGRSEIERSWCHRCRCGSRGGAGPGRGRHGGRGLVVVVVVKVSWGSRGARCFTV